MFVKKEKEDILLVSIYFDDLIYIGSSNNDNIIVFRFLQNQNQVLIR